MESKKEKSEIKKEAQVLRKKIKRSEESRSSINDKIEIKALLLRSIKIDKEN